jgi:hypothetical protein
MPADRALLVDRLQQRLLDDRGAMGWGYYSGKSSRIEPTCWALLALGGAWNPARGRWADFAQPHLSFLVQRQQPSGLLVETEPALANFTAQGLAALLLSRHGGTDHRPALTALLNGMASAKGVSVNEPDPKQDNRLQGWPWIPDTFSWVEPTAWCLLAFRKADAAVLPAAAAARVQEAEKLLLNRSCETGGWNYGNASALGQDLRPYVPTSAAALLALRPRASDPVVQRSLQFLESARLHEQTTMALALAAICLQVYERPATDVVERLAEVVSRTEQLGNLHTLALAVVALTADQHRCEAFRV